MNIELSPFGLSPNEYFRVLLRNYISRRWWLLLLDIVVLALFALAAVYVPEQLQLIHYVGVAILIVFPAVYIFRFHRLAFGGGNEAAFQQRRTTLDNEGLTFVFDDGEQTRIPWDRVLHVLNTKDFLLIYITKRQFVYLPKQAFATNQDLGEFMKFSASRKWTRSI